MTNTKMTAIWLFRHGEPCETIHGRCYGKLDVELSAVGTKQVQAAADYLRAEPLAAVYASPRRRTQQSAEILVQGRDCAVKLEKRLAEIDFGDFEGRSYEDIAASYPAIYKQWMEQPTEVQFPNGESFDQMRNRVLEAFRELLRRHSGQTIALVVHGGVNRIILADVLGVPPHNIFRIAQAYAALNLLCYYADYPSVECVNLICYGRERC